MGDGTTTFVIPVPDQRSVGDWGKAMRLLVETVSSAARQRKAPRPSVVVAAAPGADLPSEIAPLAEVVDVEREWRPLPHEWAAPRQRAIREDKGARVAAALVATRPLGHVMVVDWDDLVSPRIGRWVADHAGDNGWVADSGYIFDGRKGVVVKLRHGMQQICGTTLIARADLLQIGPSVGDIDPEWVASIYGSHRNMPTVFAERGTPLGRLPFPGVAYRVGTGLNGSRIEGIANAAQLVLPSRGAVYPHVRPTWVMRHFTS